MGTSLSGLTPATTFDGLLKTSDNDALDATLKTIGTGDGTDSVLQLSDSALQIGGTFNVDGGIATFKGVGSSSLTSSFIIKNSADDEIFRARDDQQIFAKYINGLSVSASTYALYGADYAPNIRVNIKGSGATSATTSLLVQNSAGDSIIRANDDGNVAIGSYGSDTYLNYPLDLKAPLNSTGDTLLRLQSNSTSNGHWAGIGFTTSTNGNSIQAEIRGYRDADGRSIAFHFVNNESMRVWEDGGVGIGETTPTARLHVKGSGNTNTTTSLLVQNSDATELLKVTDDATLDVSGTLTIQRSSANFAMRLGNEQRINGFIDAGQTNILSLLSAAGGGNNVYITPTGIGVNQFTPTAKLQVKGSGATSATTALLVENSAGTDLLKVYDSGTSVFSGLTTFNNNVTLRGANDTSSLNNLRFVVPGSAKSLTINKDYSSANDASAIVDIQSTTQGFLPPRMTTTERDAITTPAAGLMVYNTTTNKAQCYNGTIWSDLF